MFFGNFTPKLGEDEPILTTNIFFRWVGSSTNQLRHQASYSQMIEMIVVSHHLLTIVI